MADRIVVTGMGAISPLGLSSEESWRNAVKGKSGVGPITLCDTDGIMVKIAAEVKGFQPELYMPVKEVRRRDRFEQFGAAAAREAIEESGLVITDENRARIGVMISAAIGGITTLEQNVFVLINEGQRRVTPMVVPMYMPNGAAGLVSIDFGLTGPCFSISSACASGADGLGLATLLIKAGIIDVAVAGASEATITRIGLTAFDRAGAMSHVEEPPYPTPKPFDLNRDGLVMGEGAAILVLERESYALNRGAKILAELAGYGSTADAYHITAPDENGSGGARAIRLALESAGISPAEVDYINAHGTGTSLNDSAETLAIKSAFGELAYNIPISSTKSMTGHMMGATGALEAIFCVWAIREGIIPPTINYQTPDPACDLDYVPNHARQIPVKVAIDNAFGFGGHNAVLVFKEYESKA